MSWTARAGLVAVALLGIAGTTKLAQDHWPRPAEAPAPSPVARAQISAIGGAPLPETYPPGGLVALSAERSTLGGSPRSIRWEIGSEDAAAAAVYLAEGRQVIIPAGAVDESYDVRLYVAKGGDLDVLVRTIAIGAPPDDDGEFAKPKPKPKPKPRPRPQPKPQPQPQPQPRPAPVAVDPAVRDAAAAYFAGYVRLYADVPARIAAARPNYNEVTQAQLARRKELGEALGRAIDALTAPLYDDQLNFKDPQAAGAAYQVIADSLAAGIAAASK